MNTLNTRVLKEPLGFIRIIQFPMAILAFATTAGFGRTTLIEADCGGTTKVPGPSIPWGYPFGLDHIAYTKNICSTATTDSVYPFAYGTVSQSQFFVFVGVISFFYIMAIVGLYLFAWSKYENDGRFPLGDFLVTAVLAVFWFIASCAWSSGVTTVKTYTEKVKILDRLKSSTEGTYPCNNGTEKCSITNDWNYASLNVSLIAGFACCGLWLANLWFIYKETPWYKARAAITTPSTGPGVGTSGASTPSGGNTFR